MFYIPFTSSVVLISEFEKQEHVSVERFTVPPSEAQHIEIVLTQDDQLPDGEFIKQLLLYASNKYEGRIIKRSDFLCFDFYGRSLSLKISKVQTFPNGGGIEKQMENINLNDSFYHISSSTTWSIKGDNIKSKTIYPISDIGGINNLYEKIMTIIQKTNCHRSE